MQTENDMSAQLKKVVSERDSALFLLREAEQKEVQAQSALAQERAACAADATTSDNQLRQQCAMQMHLQVC